MATFDFSPLYRSSVEFDQLPALHFDLAEYVEVTHTSLENGLLEITLEQERPEALKPRRIPIGPPASADPRTDDNARPAVLKAA